jgi:hypothetical protein
MEQSRTQMMSRRADAVKGEAERLAKDQFDSAHAKQTEAEGLASGQNFAAAGQAYQAAADAYQEALSRAGITREARGQADSAKERMLAEKQKADQKALAFDAALAEERQAVALYDRLAYREAAEKFRSAEQLFVRAATRPAPAQKEAPPSQPSGKQAPFRPPPTF